MKRVILSSIPILGMSYERKVVRAKVASKSEQIKTHLLKCLLYPKAAAYNHWITELSAFIDAVNSYTVKPKGKKLTAQEYIDLTFQMLGEDERDARAILKEFYSEFMNNPKYEMFKITPELISKTNDLCREVEQEISNMLADNTSDYEIEDFQTKLRSILSKYH